jgi:hypothetical protein
MEKFRYFLTFLKLCTIMENNLKLVSFITKYVPLRMTL